MSRGTISKHVRSHSGLVFTFRSSPNSANSSRRPDTLSLPNESNLAASILLHPSPSSALFTGAYVGSNEAIVFCYARPERSGVLRAAWTVRIFRRRSQSRKLYGNGKSLGGGFLASSPSLATQLPGTVGVILASLQRTSKKSIRHCGGFSTTPATFTEGCNPRGLRELREPLSATGMIGER